ncbi:MAG: sugar ABC transporter permease [Betaproteobacteria bacterium AqS2]|uniref:Sugar ABC transporter permease n=1 Tax=Candidatus Amphirhobacter heronislandensis TaxID=1732024 RepID=A0A930UFA6_9GAMM|nr:sugar ABC transporter permease [Betaproteobacteria bacterium AqS2]
MAAAAPRALGPLARREQRLAYALLAPTVGVVLLVVLAPLLANFWISAKPVRLEDLRPPQLFVNERLRGDIEAAGDVAAIEYRLRNSSRKDELRAARFTDVLPEEVEAVEVDGRCGLDGRRLACDLGTLAPGASFRLTVLFRALAAGRPDVRASAPAAAAEADSVLTSLEFSFANFQLLFSAHDFWEVLKVSFYYTVFGTAGALLLGLCAAQMLFKDFAGRGFLRGLFLFPYVAPVIAVAFAWVVLLDPFSGTVNAMLQRMGAVAEPVNFLGARYVELGFFGLAFDFPLALATVIAFEAWRYFPLSFLFILARMQALPASLYEAAEMDAATPLQQFWRIGMPQLAGILAVLFLLRFIWTFNKFDDIFLLTGGAAGTRTLTVNVYEQAFALSNLGAGAAVAVLIFVLLLGFSLVFIKYAPKDEG